MSWKLLVVIGGIGIVMLFVAAYLNRRARSARDARPVDMDAVRTDVIAALDQDGLAEAVKIYRQRTGARLLEATEAVQRIDRARGPADR